MERRSRSREPRQIGGGAPARFLKEAKTALTTKGTRVRLPLHQRIVNLGKRNKSLSDALLAVKWLGNVGSHSDDLTKDDLFDALDILETVLDDVFVRHRQAIRKLITAINKKKGPPKK